MAENNKENKKSLMDVFNDLSEVSKNFLNALDDVKRRHFSEEEKKEEQCSCNQEESGCENKCFNNGPEIDFKKFGEIIGGVLKPIKEAVSPMLDEMLPDKEEIDQYLSSASDLIGKVFESIGKGFEEIMSIVDEDEDEDEDDDNQDINEAIDKLDETIENAATSCPDVPEEYHQVHIEIPFDNGEPGNATVTVEGDFKSNDQPVSKEYFNFPKPDETIEIEVKPTHGLKSLLQDALLNANGKITVTPVEEDEPAEVKSITYEEAYDAIIECIKNKEYALTKDEESGQPIIKVEYEIPEDTMLDYLDDEDFDSYCVRRLVDEEGFTYVNVIVDTICSDDSDGIHITVKIGL